MQTQHSRTALLIGEDGLKKLRAAHVAVFGLGGVGGHAAESLARAGVGTLDLIDGDTVDITNLNRQIFATQNTVGMAKVLAAKERLLSIDPSITINARQIFFDEAAQNQFDFAAYDFIIDAIDTISSKIALIVAAVSANVPIISAMGAGNKLRPELFQVADLAETSVCPIAKIMRRELKKHGIAHLPVVYSQEKPQKPAADIIGSLSPVPPAMGLIMAAYVVRQLLERIN